MPAARYVKPEQAQLDELKQTYRKTEQADLRTRCQMILLSAEDHTVSEIAQLTFFDQDSVLYWFDRYEASGLAGLADLPRSGRPPKSR